MVLALLPVSLTFRLLIELVVVIAFFSFGLWVGAEWELGKQARLETKQKSMVIDGLLKAREDDRANAEAVHELLAESEEARRRDGLKWERKLRDAKPQSLAVCVDGSKSDDPATPPSADGDRVALTLDFVGLWNDALCAGNSSPECSLRITDEAFKSGFALPKDILANVKANADACARDRGTLAGWQLWATKNGFIRGK